MHRLTTPVAPRPIADPGPAQAWVEQALRLRHEGQHQAAIDGLIRAAQAGSAEAHYQLGIGLAEGRDGTVDPVRARRWLRAAADRQHAAALQRLPMIEAQLAGRVAQARQLKARAEQGDLHALYTLARQLADGHFADADPDAALRCYRLAAERDHPRACLRLALCLEQGRGTRADARQALHWLIRAVEAGDGEAQYLYVRRYADGHIPPAAHPGAAQAFARCRWLYPEWRAPHTCAPSPRELQAAGQAGDLPSLYLLALAWFNGAGVRAAPHQARQLLQQAADLGYPPAQCELARAYAVGAGVPLDLERGRTLALAAARQGHFGARLDLTHSFGLAPHALDALLGPA